MLKDSDKLARVARGLSNRHRISILILLSKTSGLSVGSLSDVLGISFRAASEHSQRLEEAGLVVKRRRGQQIEHRLTLAGRRAVRFLTDLKDLI
jgi:DNA-binding transcriptional ArsR family regulator